MLDIFDDASDKDLSRNRSLDYGNNKIHIRCTDPFGFWHLSLDKGQLPEHLKGSYTTFDNARVAAEAYLAEKGKTVKEVSL